MADETVANEEVCVQDGKALLSSKIFWTNILAVAFYAAGIYFAPISLADQALVSGVVFPLLVIVLRYFSKGAIVSLK